MIKGIEIKNIPVEKIKIGDEEFKPKDSDFYENWSLRIKEFGIKKPFLVTKIGKNYMWLVKQSEKFGIKPEEALVITIDGNNQFFCQALQKGDNKD